MARSRTPLRPTPASAAIASRRSAVSRAADASHGRLHSLIVGRCVEAREVVRRVEASELVGLSDRGDKTADGRFDSKVPDASRAHSIYAVDHHSLRSLFWAVS
jgi:hypothetical protein